MDQFQKKGSSKGHVKIDLYELFNICNSVLCSFISFMHSCTDVIPLLLCYQKSTSHHPSNQSPFAQHQPSTINTLLAIWCSSILSMCLNPHNTLIHCSTSFFQCMYSFLILSICVTLIKLFKCFISSTFTNLVSAHLMPQVSAP